MFLSKLAIKSSESQMFLFWFYTHCTHPSTLVLDVISRLYAPRHVSSQTATIVCWIYDPDRKSRPVRPTVRNFKDVHINVV
jgi:hypothetical protein